MPGKIGVDGLPVKAPWSENFHSILKELYTVEEADLIVKMPYILVTSNFISHCREEICNGCGKCAKACPINAIKMTPVNDPVSKIKSKAKIDKEVCVGCGVCVMKCEKTKALKLVKREKRVLHPENVFEKLILQCLEKGTLQNQLFDNPGSITHSVMRNIMGGFYRLPVVKKALMSDALRSTFLKTITIGVKLQGIKDLLSAVLQPADNLISSSLTNGYRNTYIAFDGSLEKLGQKIIGG